MKSSNQIFPIGIQSAANKPKGRKYIHLIQFKLNFYDFSHHFFGGFHKHTLMMMNPDGEQCHRISL